MNEVVFDIEADGLYPTKIHCLSAEVDGEILSLTDYEDIRTFLTKTESLVGHNICRYDIPSIERLLNLKIQAKLIDTLALSWYLYPTRIRHGLEEWGEEFGIPKPKIDNWENLTVEEYVHRCEEDVKINSRLWKMQKRDLNRLYDDKKDLDRLIQYLTFKMDCAREQEEYGWKLDVDKCKALLDKLSEEKEAKLIELTEAMPKVAIYKTKTRPKKPYKKDGSLSEAGKSWFNLVGDSDVEEITYVEKYEEPNPGSTDQIKKWLYSLGWEPRTFQYKRDKDTGDVRKIPQVQQDKTKGPGLCPSVKELYTKEPKLEVLDGLSILTHRISILEGFLKSVDDRGYVKAEIQGFTNTLRFKHKTVVNLPGVNTAYGADIRGCLICPDDKELCGSDLSGLEDRLKQHFIFPYDPDYVNEMNQEDYDSHLDLAEKAGAVSAKQVAEYKIAEHKDKTIKAIRHIYKQGNYACQYGAGAPRVALTCGIPLHKANQVVETYWKRNWAIRQVAEDQEVKICLGVKWLYNPISRFWYYLKYEKDRFSTLVQGSGVYCFDTWVGYVRIKGPPIIGQFHDEIIALVNKGHRDKVINHISGAIDLTNNQLKLNRELACDIQFGNSYSDIH